MHRLLALLLLCVGLAACGTTQVSMSYAPSSPPAAVAGARPVVAVGAVTDARPNAEADRNWIGTIRGGYGNPVKRLDSPVPLTEVVRQAFSDALAARGLLAPAGSQPRFQLAVTITRLDANQYARREANADFGVTLTRANGGAPAWSDRGTAQRVDGSALSLATGVFASTDDLRQTAQRAMSDAVDDALNKPGFAAALR